MNLYSHVSSLNNKILRLLLIYIINVYTLYTCTYMYHMYTKCILLTLVLTCPLYIMTLLIACKVFIRLFLLKSSTPILVTILGVFNDFSFLLFPMIVLKMSIVIGHVFSNWLIADLHVNFEMLETLNTELFNLHNFCASSSSVFLTVVAKSLFTSSI